MHTILLTNPADFDKLSLDGSLSARIPNVSPEEFMAAFHPLPSEQGDETIESLEHVSILLARSMKMAFFQQISQAMTEGNFDPVKSLLKELHSKMRSLLPNRKDLHSHIDDDEVSLVSSIGDIAQLLVRSGYLLATYLESPSRAPTTRKMIDCLKTFKACSRENNGDHQDIPYQMESKQLFIVASIAFVLQKIELCQIDVSNYELSRAAFLLLCVGNEYERKHFQHKYGDYNAASVESLRTMLPSTWNWIKETKMLFENEQVTARSNFENKLNFVSRGFVDVMLFSRSQLSLPEIFALDAENIQHIRNEARCCVIASALVLHACNVSKVGSSVLSLDFISDEVNAAKEELSSVLRRKHFSQEFLEISILESIKKLTIGKLALSRNFIPNLLSLIISQFTHASIFVDDSFGSERTYQGRIHLY